MGTDSGKCLRTLEVGVVTSASFSPDGARVVTSTEDGTAKTWSAESGECLQTFVGGMLCAEFSPDGGRVATSCRDGTAKIWSADSGKCLRTLGGPLRMGCRVISAAFARS